MIELSIPQAGEETKTGKDIVFSIISRQQPLSTIEIFRIARREYNVGLTYQAIKKAIDMLVKQHVLSKEDKLYRIDKAWLMTVKKTVDNLLTNYESGKQVKGFSIDFSKDQYAVYTLTNLFDLDNFWDDILVYLSDNLPSSEDQSFVAQINYSWWLLINLGRETKLFEGFLKRNIKCYNVAKLNLPLNKWAKKTYGEIDIGYRVDHENPKDEEMVDVNIVGDNVIQVHYPKEIVKKLNNFYKKYKNTQEMSLKEITEIVHSPCEIKFTVFKNKEIAQSLRSQYLKKYKKI